MCWSELSINKNDLKGDISKATNQCWKFFHPEIIYCHLVISPSAKSLKLQLSQKLTSWQLVGLNVSEKNFLGETSFSNVLELIPSCLLGFCCDFSAEMTGHGNASGSGAFRVEIWDAEHMNEYSPLLPAPQRPPSNEKSASGTWVRAACGPGFLGYRHGLDSSPSCLSPVLKSVRKTGDLWKCYPVHFTLKHPVMAQFVYLL